MPVMNAQEIMDLIPNRSPICYVDYVDELVPDKMIRATKNVTINEDYFRGHFPGNPVMPGVLIVETAAQVASILILKSPAFRNKTAYLGAANKVKFRQMVRPGAILHFTVEIIKQRRNMGTVRFTATLDDGKKACSGELVFIVDDQERRQ